jgi:quercetin dioxygenase-like cupin family protein
MKTIVQDEGQGEKLWFYGGGVQTWKVSAGDSQGAVGVFEDRMARGKSTPLHTHPESDETVYVIEGEILIHGDGSPRTVGKGGVVFTPRGVPHAFMVTSEWARILLIATPGERAEGFYRSASVAGESGPVDFNKVGEAAQETGATVILGPPPFPRP